MARRRRYVLCLKSGGYAASLEVRKAYVLIPDRAAERRGLLRIVDESGEDYLYPADLFLPLELPLSAIKALEKQPA